MTDNRITRSYEGEKSYYSKIREVTGGEFEDSIIDHNFFISIPTIRSDWRLIEQGITDQGTLIKLLRLESSIRNYGGAIVKRLASGEDTSVYFLMTRTSFNVFKNSIKANFPNSRLGEVKSI